MGRPTRYNKEFGRMAKCACKLGATNEDLAELFGVTARTIENWSKKYPDEFFRPIKEGKAEADENVRDALYHRACGYSHDHEHISIYNGIPIVTPTVKHYPPDTTACIFWLCNRDADNWKRNGEESGSNTDDIAEALLKLTQVLPT